MFISLHWFIDLSLRHWRWIEWMEAFCMIIMEDIIHRMREYVNSKLDIVCSMAISCLLFVSLSLDSPRIKRQSQLNLIRVRSKKRPSQFFYRYMGSTSRARQDLPPNAMIMPLSRLTAQAGYVGFGAQDDVQAE